MIEINNLTSITVKEKHLKDIVSNVLKEEKKKKFGLSIALVGRAEHWRWGSLWRRTFGDAEAQALLHDGPTPRPRNWRAWVNQPQTEAELAALRRCVTKGRPFGGNVWVKRTAARLHLRCTLRPRGRPRKTPQTGQAGHATPNKGS